MDVVRIFETTVAERELGVSLSCLSVPESSLSGLLPPDALGREPDAWAEALGLKVIERGPPSTIPLGLLALLVSTNVEDALLLLQTLRETPPPQVYERFDPHLYEFAEYVAYTPMVTFEASPAELRSLASIAANRGPAGIGTAIAFAAVGATPLLLIAVPAAIVLVALGEGLRYHLLRIMRVPQASQESREGQED